MGNQLRVQRLYHEAELIKKGGGHKWLRIQQITI
jgi:hypothetical protein